MSRNVSLKEASAHLSQWVREAEGGESVVIVRSGKPVAALVPVSDLERLAAGRQTDPQRGLAGLAGGWEGSEELVKTLGRFRRSRPRATPKLP